MNKEDKVPLSVQPAPQDTLWWLPRHEVKLAQKNAMERVDLVFLGDSITQAWEQEGADVWQAFYQSRQALNLGFNGDKTENVLWRLANGEVDNIQPKLLVLLIGTNNTGHRMDKAEDTALGIKQILSVLAEKLPKTKVLLLAIFPRSAKPRQKLRTLNNEVNQLIRTYADDKKVFFLDINSLFLDEKGQLTSDVMNDFLHPNASQYQFFADAIEPYIIELMASD
ncbi:acetylglucosamine-6-sulfatase [Marinomonas sp. M1K-6]|uniref:Acetylglucosamine-6-sulfatase n=1 Tax=Marinomonas profundi TaxID=2726122 RepID=A0A847R961_9GAMM|nr:GDSL-type esterase/lipase family protein [Marinomonas profundi]NLQ17717.1 acetylglucosamine-6-sulfatase [Marinomonas profundi]UDV04276.1 acetylglucosamine-6-sulfatase [Marinomonas profundi]